MKMESRHAEDRKTGSQENRGRRRSASPVFSSVKGNEMSEAGVRLGRDRKKKLISLYAPAVESYSRLEGRHTVFDCENGFCLDVLWRKHNFEHLCGVYCDRPPEVIHAGRLTEAEFFYDALRKGRLAVDSIHYPDYRKAYGKALVLHEILSLPIGVEVIVDSDKSSIDYFYGNDHWCLGLDAYHDTNRIDSSFSDGFVHYPKSVRKQSVSARRRESGNAYRVLSITIVDNR